MYLAFARKGNFPVTKWSSHPEFSLGIWRWAKTSGNFENWTWSLTNIDTNVKNIKPLFRMSLNGLLCLSETFSNEPSDTKRFQFVMHLRQNQEEKLHLLFPAGSLKAPDWDSPTLPMLHCGQHTSCSIPWLARAAMGKPECQETLQNSGRATVHRQPRQPVVMEGLSVPILCWALTETCKRHKGSGPLLTQGSSLNSNNKNRQVGRWAFLQISISLLTLL